MAKKASRQAFKQQMRMLSVGIKADGSFGEMGIDDMFDDCAVCQVMKKAMLEGREPTEAELDAASAEVSRLGGTFGSTVDTQRMFGPRSAEA